MGQKQICLVYYRQLSDIETKKWNNNQIKDAGRGKNKKKYVSTLEKKEGLSVFVGETGGEMKSSRATAWTERWGQISGERGLWGVSGKGLDPKQGVRKTLQK